MCMGRPWVKLDCYLPAKLSVNREINSYKCLKCHYENDSERNRECKIYRSLNVKYS